MLKKQVTVRLLPIMGFAFLVFASEAKADIVFQSDFNGTTGSQIASLPEWSNAAIVTGSYRTIVDNTGRLYCNGSAWMISSIRADKSEGVAKNFNPMDSTGNRFEYSITSVDSEDPSSSSMMRMWISTQSAATNSVTYTTGQHFSLCSVWSKTSNTMMIYFNIINNTGTGKNIGAEMCQMTTSVDLDGGDQIRFALELRDDVASNDVRIAYQKYQSGAWSDWTSSAWYNPTNTAYGANAFDASWTTTWADNTYFYIEQNAQKVGTAPYTLTTTYIDNVTVTGIPEPATLGLVTVGGALCMIRKKR